MTDEYKPAANDKGYNYRDSFATGVAGAAGDKTIYDIYGPKDSPFAPFHQNMLEAYRNRNTDDSRSYYALRDEYIRQLGHKPDDIWRKAVDTIAERHVNGKTLADYGPAPELGYAPSTLTRQLAPEDVRARTQLVNKVSAAREQAWQEFYKNKYPKLLRQAQFGDKLTQPINPDVFKNYAESLFKARYDYDAAQLGKEHDTLGPQSPFVQQLSESEQKFDEKTSIEFLKLPRQYTAIGAETIAIVHDGVVGDAYNASHEFMGASVTQPLKALPKPLYSDTPNGLKVETPVPANDTGGSQPPQPPKKPTFKAATDGGKGGKIYAPDPTKQAIPTAGGIDGSGASGATSVPPVSPPNSGATSVPPVSPPNSGAKTPSIKEVLAAAGRVAPLVAKIEPHVQVGLQAVTAAFETGEKVHKGDEVGNSLKSVDKFTIYTLKLEAQRADWAEAANANPNNAELRADLAKLDQEIAWHEKLLPTVRVWQQSVKPAHDAEGLTPSPEAQKLRDDSTTLYVYLRNETVNKWQELELITKRIPGKGSELDFATAAQKQAEAAMGVIMNGDADTTEGEAQKFRAKALDEIMHKQLAKDKDAADIARNLFIKSKSKPHEKNKLKENALAAAQQEENTARWLLKRNPDDVQAQDGALHAGDVNHSLTGTPRWQNRQDERRQVQTPAPVPDWVAGHVRNDRYDFKTTTPTWAAEGDGRDGRGRDGRGRDGRGRDADTTTPIGTDAGATPRAGTGAANPGDNSWLRNQNVAKQINDLNEQMLSLDRGQPVEVNPGMHQPPATPVPTAASRVRTPQHPPAKRNVEALSVGTVFIRALPVSGTRFDCIQVPESGVGSPTPGTSKYSDSNCQIPIKR